MKPAVRSFLGRKMVPTSSLLSLLLLTCFTLAVQAQESATGAQIKPNAEASHFDPTGGLLAEPTAKDQATLRRAQDISKSIAATDWLGALSPVAISPFFGMACLSGIAIYGPDFIRERSGLFDESSPLANPYLFWTMAILTVMTSLPRFSKVSKPIAMIADRLESYSVIVILVCVRLFGQIDEGPNAPVVAALPIQVAGIETLPLDIALAAFAWLNLIVVGTIKLFFEFLIWLTPVPALDAMFEAANKSISGALTALYCFSPVAAAVLNILLLLVCSSIFFWVSRRLHYYLHVMALPWLWRLIGRHTDPHYLAEPLFLADAWRSWPLYSKVRVSGSEDDGWVITGKRFGIFRLRSRLGPGKIVVNQDMLRHRASIDDGSRSPLTFYFRK